MVAARGTASTEGTIMSTGTLATTDHDIQQAVQDELLWSPEIDNARIGVAVQDGVVMLSGEIDDHPERIAAEHAALRTAGVTTVVDDLVIHHASYVWAVSETDIATRVEPVIAALAHFPDSVRATVENHTVTLSGEVEWN
jgi:osmotically-inducible protein OsmY